MKEQLKSFVGKANAKGKKSIFSTKKIGVLLFLISTLLAGGVSLSSCSDDDENSFPEGTWEYVAVEGNDSLIVTLENYPKDKKFYSTNYNSGTNVYAMFLDRAWYTYEIDNETILISTEQNAKSSWIFKQVSDNEISLLYNDIRPMVEDGCIYSYTFTRKK
jgi:hypothetical protein